MLSLGAGQMQSEVSVPLLLNVRSMYVNPGRCLSSAEDSLLASFWKQQGRCSSPPGAVTGCERGHGACLLEGGGEPVSR